MIRYELYSSGARLCSSPQLGLSETRRASDGALVVTGTGGPGRALRGLPDSGGEDVPQHPYGALVVVRGGDRLVQVQRAEADQAGAVAVRHRGQGGDRSAAGLVAALPPDLSRRAPPRIDLCQCLRTAL